MERTKIIDAAGGAGALRPVGRQRLYAILLFAGAAVLFYRTIALLAGGAIRTHRPWVVALTVAEMGIDAVTMAASARWAMTRADRHSHLALRASAATTFLHAFRVLVFVLGRTGPWVDFDVRQEHREGHQDRWTWAQVVFAGVMSFLGVIAAIGVWRLRARRHVTGALAV